MKNYINSENQNKNVLIDNNSLLTNNSYKTGIFSENNLDFLLKDQIKAFNLICGDLESEQNQGNSFPYLESSKDSIVIKEIEKNNVLIPLKSELLDNGLSNPFGSPASRNIAMNVVKAIKDYEFRDKPEGSAIHSEFLKLCNHTSESYLNQHNNFNISDDIIGNAFLYLLLGVDISVNVEQLSLDLHSIYRFTDSVPMGINNNSIVEYDPLNNSKLLIDLEQNAENLKETLKEIDLVKESNKSNFNKICGISYSNISGILTQCGLVNTYAQYSVIGLCGLGITYFAGPFVFKKTVELIKEGISENSDIIVPESKKSSDDFKLSSFNEIISKFVKDIVNKIFDKD